MVKNICEGKENQVIQGIAESMLHNEDICKGTENQDGITDNSDDEQSATDSIDSHQSEDCLDNIPKLKIMDVPDKKEKKCFPAHCTEAVSLTTNKLSYFVSMHYQSSLWINCTCVHHLIKNCVLNLPYYSKT
jgi:hypothetical protein